MKINETNSCVSWISDDDSILESLLGCSSNFSVMMADYTHSWKTPRVCACRYNTTCTHIYVVFFNW